MSLHALHVDINAVAVLIINFSGIVRQNCQVPVIL